jgi:tRNA G18 (ribose-2'-O)-methylase SpoU
MTQLNRLTVEEFRDSDKIPVVIVLDNIRSQNNVGSVFRIADAFRVRELHLCGITATPPHREIHKTALGATESVQWKYFAHTRDAVALLKQEGYRIVCVEQVEGGISLDRFNPPRRAPLALVFGNEINGIEDEVLTEADECIEIPQFGTKHSINVSVAAGIVVWDLFLKNDFFSDI